MEAKGQSLKTLFDTDILEVPFFQRAYVWNKENWEELLDDLFEANGKHFLGSIILKKHEQQIEGHTRKVIIDGQQRLTTLSILIKALYDCMTDQQKKILDDAKSILFYKEKSTDEIYNISIHHSHNDSSQFKGVIGEVQENECITSPDINDKEWKDIRIEGKEQKLLITRCYKYFYTRLSDLYATERKKIDTLWNSLLSKTNNILVVIDLGAEESEQKIFDSINTAGMRLSATDTIKNALYQKLMEISSNKDEVIKYYEATWRRTFEGDDDAMAYWNKTKSIGRTYFQNSELLLKNVAIIDKFFDTGNNSKPQLPDLYKKKIKNANESEIKALIKDIIDYAKIYKERFQNFTYNDSFEFSDAERRLLKILDVQETSIYDPYILFLFKKYSNNKESLERRMINLEKLVIKLLITNTATKGINKQIDKFIDDGDREIDKLSSNIDPSKMREALTTNVSNKVAKILLFWVELYRRHKDKKYDIKTLQYHYQLEHIMPIKWEENWKSVSYVDSENNKLPNNEKSKQKRIEKITSIGNMTLLSSNLNSAISNGSFKKKIEGDEDKKNGYGLEHYASLSITKDDIIENVYKKGKEWNEATIAEREQALINEIIEIWG